MAKIEMTIIDHVPELNEEIKAKLPLLLESWGATAQKYARDLCPVDTGDLKKSISHKIDKANSTVYVGTNLKYGVYQEFGNYNHKVGEKHFLRNSILHHKEHYKHLAEAFFKSFE